MIPRPIPTSVARCRGPERDRDAQTLATMTATYKVTGINPGETDLSLGNCLILRRCRDATNTSGMYAKIRNTAMGWMNSPGSVNNFVFFEELFASDVVLDHANPEPRQRGDSMESAVLVAALLIAFPEARFGIGLAGREDSLSGGHYRSLGKQSVALPDGGQGRTLLARLFDYLRHNSYWVDDDLVHILALLSAACEDRDRTTPVQVLSLSTSGNHQVDPGLFHTYQLVEALLEVRHHEPLPDAVARWNDAYPFRLNPDEIEFIKYLRDTSLHFRADHAGPRLADTRIALGFDQDAGREREFRTYGIQRLLREVARAYFLTRLPPVHTAS